MQINNGGPKCDSSVHACFDQLCYNADGSPDKFVRNAVEYIKENNLDGLEFDIEWSTSEWTNYNILLDGLKTAIGSPGYIGADVTATAGSLTVSV